MQRKSDKFKVTFTRVQFTAILLILGAMNSLFYTPFSLTFKAPHSSTVSSSGLREMRKYGVCIMDFNNWPFVSSLQPDQTEQWKIKLV